jgi:predicted site-specific integrase-resolvase
MDELVKSEVVPPRRPTVSIAQAAQILGVSRRTVYNRIRDGLVETKRLSHANGTRVYVDSLANVEVPQPRRK